MVAADRHLATYRPGVSQDNPRHTQAALILSFLFVAACIVAGGYFVSGMEKLRIGWLTYGHLDLMPLTAYAHFPSGKVLEVSRGRTRAYPGRDRSDTVIVKAGKNRKIADPTPHCG